MQVVYGQIYLITNLVNGKKYVGQTTGCIRKRLRNHSYQTKSGKGAMCIKYSIRKHGVENFSVGSLCTCSHKEELDLMEDLYIVLYNTMNSSVGYNCKRGGAHGKASERTKLLLSLRSPANYREDVSTTEIVRLYEEGLSTRKIGSLFDMDSSAVWDRLTGSGVSKRHRGCGKIPELEKQKLREKFSGNGSSSYRHDVSTDDMVRLYAEGYSTLQIGDLLLINNVTVWYRLKKLGVEMRSARYRKPK